MVDEIGIGKKVYKQWNPQLFNPLKEGKKRPIHLIITSFASFVRSFLTCRQGQGFRRLFCELAMEEITEGVKNIAIATTESHKKNRIQVSNTKKPLFFYVNLAKVRTEQTTKNTSFVSIDFPFDLWFGFLILDFYFAEIYATA